MSVFLLEALVKEVRFFLLAAFVANVLAVASRFLTNSPLPDEAIRFVAIHFEELVLSGLALGLASIALIVPRDSALA